ncbi:MAG: ROK family protein [Chlorobi bacterium]|nr:ROK family protein [Chlorobiota bacterium]
MEIIGVDIGGTKISAGLIVNEKLVKIETCPTPSEQPKEVVVRAITDVIEKVYDPGISGIGVGVPGLIDQKEKLVIDTVNIPSWDIVPLHESLTKHFNKPVYIDNDANCFAVGEKHFGKGKPYSNFVGVTMGTGLGAGIIINNSLYSGNFCGAGEFGLMYYRESIIEAYCSGQFFEARGKNGGEVAQMAADGDREALKLFDELGTHIGRAITNILFALAPEAIILGGSVSKSYNLFEPALKKVLKEEFPYQRVSQALKIEVSDAENMAILGASSLVLNELLPG